MPVNYAELNDIVSVYDYTDYKAYLNAYFKERKSNDSNFSYQLVANALGIKSRGHLYKIIHDEATKLTLPQIFQFSKVIHHNTPERDFFYNLVFFTQTTDSEEKNFFYEKMSNQMDPARGVSLQRQFYEYFSYWYVPVIRELITMREFDGNLYRLSRKLSPPISQEQCKTAVKLLLDLGLVKQATSGKYVQQDITIKAGPQIQKLAMRNYTTQAIELSKESIERFEHELRDLTTITFGVTEQGIDQLKEKIKQFRKRVFSMLPEWDADMDRVYQLNIQLFPLTKCKTKKENP